MILPGRLGWQASAGEAFQMLLVTSAGFRRDRGDDVHRHDWFLLLHGLHHGFRPSSAQHASTSRQSIPSCDRGPINTNFPRETICGSKHARAMQTAPSPPTEFDWLLAAGAQSSETSWIGGPPRECHCDARKRPLRMNRSQDWVIGSD